MDLPSDRTCFRLHSDPWGRLVLTDTQGREHVGAEPVRAFPITDPAHGISICDAEGRELVWIDDLDQVPQPSRGTLEEALARRQFLPTLRRVLKVHGSTEPCEWDIETDRGRTRLHLKSDEDVRRLAGHRAIVTDAHGIRYLIPDLRDLDTASRRALERYL
jgi:hypothetical protein